jgi:hypothetical protein
LVGVGFAWLAIAFFGAAHAQEAGTWAGTVDQPGASPYQVIMVLDGQGGGSTDYPALNCGGALSGGPGTYAETITTNRAEPGGSSGCIDGYITVSVQGDSMAWSWSGNWEGQAYSASATLTRTGGGASAACDTCGRALSADVAAGLSSSAMLSTYVQQSLGKYANCTRREAMQCADDCWRANLADLLPNCDQFNDAGHRACVNQTVVGANATCQ